MLQRRRLLNEYHAALQGHVARLEQAGQLKTLATAADMEYETYFNKAFIAGTPETVRAELQKYGDAGIRHMALWFNFGFMTAEEADRSLDLFMEEVYPKLDPDTVDQA
jgi:alkanesulfonate monooxygenase SsuD/methylene tetrahydromethanopterin reductase-like flavin-dependent oxidoreductase (luciferase family)